MLITLIAELDWEDIDIDLMMLDCWCVGDQTVVSSVLAPRTAARP